MLNATQFRRLHEATRPEQVSVSEETFRRLPQMARSFYARRLRRGGISIPSELAMRCLANDYRRSGYNAGGLKSVDGWTPGGTNGRPRENEYTAFSAYIPLPQESARASHGL